MAAESDHGRRTHGEGPRNLPHILLIVLDDLGSNDLGMHKSGINTPNIDQLAHEGIFLDNYYVLPYCSPTRASLLSGRYPLHTGCHSVIFNHQTQGLPLDEQTLPEVLQSVGYAAHAVGKWHVGHSRWEQTPTFRGFESFYGYYLGEQGYYSHISESSVLPSHPTGYDFRYDKQPFCGANCSQLVDVRGQYSTHAFTTQAQRLIRRHARRRAFSQTNELNHESEPLFIYLAHQAVHWPDEVPESYTAPYLGRNWTDQRIVYAGMLSAADESIANVTKTLEEYGLWNNTLVIVTTDNGGPTDVCSVQGSSNYPRRGGKCSVWEGGTRGDAFLSGPYLSRLRQKCNASCIIGDKTEEYENLFHVVDWLPTIAALTGARASGKPLDGVSHLEALICPGCASPPREELYIGYANYENRWYGPAVRHGRWKLVQGRSGGPDAHDDYPAGDDAPAPGGSIDRNSTYILFDLVEDIGEKRDVAHLYPEIVSFLQSRLREYQLSFVPPISEDSLCPFPGLVNTTLFGPVWMPWCRGSSEVVVYS
jgi:arylsulfatase A-like enzyme